MVTLASSLVSIGAVCWGLTIWFTGGLRPQTQIDQDGFKAQLASIQDAQKVQANEVRMWRDEMIGRFDRLPRPSDYANQDAHLSRIDTAISSISDRITADELKAVEIATQVRRLTDGTTAPLRFPRSN